MQLNFAYRINVVNMLIFWRDLFRVFRIEVLSENTKDVKTDCRVHKINVLDFMFNEIARTAFSFFITKNELVTFNRVT